MKNDKWFMFQNYMHNELGITKEDIRVWLEEAIKKEAEKLVANTFKDFSLTRLIKNEIFKNEYAFTDSVKNEVVKIIKENLNMKLELKVKDDKEYGRYK